jgi:hypothetical protein
MARRLILRVHQLAVAGDVILAFGGVGVGACLIGSGGMAAGWAGVAASGAAGILALADASRFWQSVQRHAVFADVRGTTFDEVRPSLTTWATMHTAAAGGGTFPGTHV